MEQIEILSGKEARLAIGSRFGYEISGDTEVGSGVMSLILKLYELNKQLENQVADLKEDIKYLKNPSQYY